MMEQMAFVHEDAKLGRDVKIEPFATVYEDVEIGEGTWIGPHATIMPGTRIGKNCKVFPGAVVGAIPQDLKFQGEYTTVEIGDHTTIRECVTINRGTNDRKTTKVGSHCLLMAYVHVAHDCSLGDYCILANNVALAGHVTIHDHAILEGLVAVQQFVEIGAHAFVAGASLVRKNVPPYVKAAREPISFVGVNSIGLKRRGWDADTIKTIEDVYRTIFVHHSNVSAGMKAVEESFPDTEIKREILSFIQNAEKGVIRGAISH